MSSTELSAADRTTLLRTARASVEHWLAHQRALPVELAEYPPSLRADGASFVTLTIAGQLRGCIGTLEAYRPLIQDVAENAANASGHDYRFKPLTREEYPHIHIEISILSAPQALVIEDEADLLRQLRPGVDGLIIAHGDKRATFLPAVWEKVPHADVFLRELKAKAGISGREQGRLAAWRYTAESIAE